MQRLLSVPHTGYNEYSVYNEDNWNKHGINVVGTYVAIYTVLVRWIYQMYNATINIHLHEDPLV